MATPARGPRPSGALLEIDQIEFLADFGLAEPHLISDPQNGLVDAQTGLHANHHQIQRLRQAQPDLELP